MLFRSVVGHFTHFLVRRAFLAGLGEVDVVDVAAGAVAHDGDKLGVLPVGAKQLLEASLRLRPDRILLAELRGEEAYHFLRNVSSGHPGSITSVHAGSVELAIEQVSLLVRESSAGRDLSLADLRRLLHAVIDVVVYCAREGERRVVKAIWWRDAREPATVALEAGGRGP